jgi:formate hydrogenlyase subunit 6/NADH:ubiquinone oxidoreductase subunit I
VAAVPQWFVKGLRRGVVTTRYPARADSSASLLPGPPAFRSEELTGQIADSLAQICPSRALTRDGDVLVFDAGACTACGRCRESQPRAVIASGEFGLAATDRSALVKRIPLLGEAGQ